MLTVDTKQLNDVQFEEFFYTQVVLNDYFACKKMLLSSDSKYRIFNNKDLLLLGLLKSTEHEDNKIFVALYEGMVKNVVGFENDFLYYMFNAMCQNNNKNGLVFLDQKNSLSSYFMNQCADLIIEKLLNFEPKENPITEFNYSNSEGFVVSSLRYNKFMHGFLCACYKHESIAFYLLDKTSSSPVSLELLTYGLILSCHHHKYELAYSIINKLKQFDINNDNLLNNYVKWHSSVETKNFLAKVALESTLDNRLSNEQTTSKRLKV